MKKSKGAVEVRNKKIVFFICCLLAIVVFFYFFREPEDAGAHFLILVGVIIAVYYAVYPRKIDSRDFKIS